MRHLSLLILLAFTALLSQAQDFQWVKTIPAFTGHPYADNKSAAAPAGYTYHAHEFYDTLRLGSYTLASLGYNQYVAKVSPLGDIVWAVPFSGSDPTPPSSISPFGEVQDVESDPTGNCFITGTFYSQVQIGSFLLYGSTQDLNSYVAKIDPAGNVLWAKTISGGDDDYFRSLSVDGTGNLYMAAFSDNWPYLFDGQPMPIQRGVIKLDPNGAIIQSIQMPFIGHLTVKPTGEMYITGRNYSNLPFNLGNGLIIPPNGTYMAYYSISGQLQWMRHLTGSTIYIWTLKIDSSGNAILMGGYADSLTFGTGNSTLSGNPTLDLFLLKASDTGMLLWQNRLGHLATYNVGSGFYITPKMDLDLAGNVVVANVFSDSVALSPSFTYYSTSPGYDIMIAKYRTDGSLMWWQTITGPTTEVIAGLSALENVTLHGILGNNSSTPVTSHFGSQDLVTTKSVLFIASISNDMNQISGSVFIDQNASGIKDAGEAGVPYLRLQFQNGQAFYTDALGNYTAYTDTGTYQITIPQLPSYYSSTPASHSAVFTAIGQTDSANHFALQPQSSVTDISISVVQLNVPRPGFPYKTRLVYKNLGTTVQNGTVKLLPDSLLVFNNASPAVMGVNGDTLVWSFTALQPFETRHILVEWQVPATLSIGGIFSLAASIKLAAIDQDTSNNSISVTDTIRGSYDPNDKLVSHRMLSPVQISAGEWLIYTIRFQNTGTDTAFFAVVRDELSPLLEMNTLQVISASHPFTMQLTGLTSVEWDFGTILLPDSNTNEPASHGYIQYRIKPLPTLTLGQHINTHANIFFDFNAPVMTNITDTEVGVVTVVPDEMNNILMRLYPNPASTSTTLIYSIPTGAQQPELSIQELTTGRTVRQYALKAGSSQQEVRLTGLANGMYAVTLRVDGKVVQVQKMALIR